jgi:hypothetical protein
MARNEELQEKLLATAWDLVIFDEAHKLSAHFFGSKLEKTGRFLFAEKLGARTRFNGTLPPPFCFLSPSGRFRYTHWIIPTLRGRSADARDESGKSQSH